MSKAEANLRDPQYDPQRKLENRIELNQKISLMKTDFIWYGFLD